MENCSFCDWISCVVLHSTLRQYFKCHSEFVFQELPEMVLLKFFRPENTPVPARPTPEQLSNLIKTSLHYPESFNHSFHQKRFVQCFL